MRLVTTVKRSASNRVLKKAHGDGSRGERAPDALDAGALGPGPTIRKPWWFGGLCPGRAPRRPGVLSPLPSATVASPFFQHPAKSWRAITPQHAAADGQSHWASPAGLPEDRRGLKLSV